MPIPPLRFACTRQSNFKRLQTGLPDFAHWKISANPDDKFLGPVVATIYSKSSIQKAHGKYLVVCVVALFAM